MNYSHALNQYQQVSVHSAVEDASPHRLIELLLQGFGSRVAEAKVAMINKKTEIKGQKISKALDILSGLRSSLDFDAGDDIAVQLDELYDYMGRQLVSANANNSVELCDEVIQLMGVIESAWQQVREAS